MRIRSEDDLVARLREICAQVAPQKLVLGIGDDAAAWRPSRSALSVISTDALVEDVHFSLAAMSAYDIGFRALAASLSDIAAMGARPILATVALGLREQSDLDWIESLYEGLAALARRSDCALAGGDITRSPVISLAITVVGEVRPSNLKQRSGARRGDVIAVTAPLGASHAGLQLITRRSERSADVDCAAALRAFRTPEPHLKAGRWLGASRSVHALMDSSDGLSTDLTRLCRASGTGAVIEHVPIHSAACVVAELLGDNAENYALHGGEDFALIVAIAPRAFRYLAGRFVATFGTPLLRVGTITAGTSLSWPDGQPISAAGWDHLAR